MEPQIKSGVPCDTKQAFRSEHSILDSVSWPYANVRGPVPAQPVLRISMTHVFVRQSTTSAARKALNEQNIWPRPRMQAHFAARFHITG